MAISILTGKISHIQHATETSGQISGHGGNVSGSIQTAHALSFRINNKPARMKSKLQVSFSDGDEITAAGEEKNGTFNIISSRNETTGALYETSPTIFKWAGWALTIFGGVLFFLVFPLLFAALGVYLIILSKKIEKANELLRATPVRSH